ncbi:DNA polymerase subunit gamma-1, mitochondrial [Cyphomyrmex costatus]|uniref:DNA polymerase subunit gamma-1 n=1 Tax=Cyphomyrmex costatus TaxID=456900 RepID=A0A195CJ81_9HYME|nr:DNA polymerase subunit gamma-1, mitochondrial [Cyphomyrmex costatus]
MRLRTCLINICIRYKYTNAQDGIHLSKIQWKRVRLKNSQKSNPENLTSKDDKLTTNSLHNSPAIPVNFEDYHKLFAKSEKVPSKLNVNIQISKKSTTEQNINSGIKSNNKSTDNINMQVTELDQQLQQNKSEELRESKNSTNIDSNANKKNNNVRVNEINMQMLPKVLHQQLFRKDDKENCLSKEEVDSIKKNLITYSINVEDATRLPDVNLKLPVLEGKDIEEHFYNIGKAQAEPYLKIISDIMNDIPKMPTQWLFKEGWTRYTADGIAESIDYPLENGVIFDVEVCMKQGSLPTLATAVSNKAWYSWVSNSLAQSISQTFDTQLFTPSILISMESSKEEYGQRLNQHQKKPKIIVGHNVSYDRSRIKEQYWLNSTGTRFLDTMSLHVCVSGLNSYQRSLLISKKADMEKEIWQSTTSLNSLVEVHKLYCGYEISKEGRDLFVEGTIEDIKDNFNMLMSYCASDVVATHNILCKLFPLFQERFPHPVTLAGMLELSSAYLPVNSNWQRYLEESESTFDDLNYEAKFTLAKRADTVCHLMHNEKYKKDLWMWDQDWSTQNIKMKSKISKVKTANIETDIMGPQNISTSMQVVPKLLNLTWEKYPLHYIKDHGWGILVPYKNNPETKLPLENLLAQCPLPAPSPSRDSSDDAMATLSTDVQNDLHKTEFWRLKKKQNKLYDEIYKGTGVWCNIDIDNCCYFFKLPHKDGANFNVGNPLAKDFLNKFSENVLAGLDVSAAEVLKIARMLSYWRNNRDRIMSQLVIWLDDHSLPSSIKKTKRYMRYGAIIPQVVVSGTLTRRAVEPTWMTASNAHVERIGSELRCMVQAPPGYNIVGADVDSQELWIASIIGDAHYKRVHGATPFGWMTLIGTKSNGTDMHSVTAKAIGISRDHAKIINYARIYGAGQKFAERLLKQFNPSMTDAEAISKSRKMFALTKGKKVFRLKTEFVNDDLQDIAYTSSQAYKIAKLHGKALQDIFLKSEWMGGSESAMFNRLEQIAGSQYPVTPFLDARLSRALEITNTDNDDKFLPTKINWVVQSGAVDFLHLMLVSMRWLMRDNARFCLSFHDEVRYLVPSKYKYNVALAMHVTNLMTRSFCASRLGMKDLPMSVAFFSAVEVDTVLRKESTHDCKTPSNPHGLQNGYEIPPGESLDIWAALEKSGGSLGYWHDTKNRKVKPDSTVKKLPQSHKKLLK